MSEEAVRLSAEEARQKDSSERTKAYWLSKLLIGHKVIEKVSGLTGEVYKIESWGVQVWIPDLDYNRQNWTWFMLAQRSPRKIKRYPRPFRFPREVPTECCHCKMGRMEVEGENKVRCTRCKFLIGDESFPRRIKRAESFLRKAAQPTSGKRKRSLPRRKRANPKKVARQKDGKISHPHRAKVKSKRKVLRRVDVRSGGRKEESGNGQDQSTGDQKIPETSNPAIPTPPDTTIPQAPGQEIQKQEEVR